MKWLWILSLLVLSLFSKAATADFDTDYWYAFAVDKPPADIDHGFWDVFLDRYQEAQAGESVHRIDYESVSAADLAGLSDYIDYSASLDPRYHDYDRQLANWLNLHNALVTKIILHYRADDLHDLAAAIGSKGEPGSHRSAPLVTVTGRDLSLDNIVDDILIPIWQNPDIYFLATCASADCPEIPQDVLRAANV